MVDGSRTHNSGANEVARRKAEQTFRIDIRISKSLKDRIERHAAEAGVKFSKYIRDGMTELMDRRDAERQPKSKHGKPKT